jgi:hypothetical protein
MHMLIGSEKACGLAYDQEAIQAYVADKVSTDDLQFLSDMNAYAGLTEVRLKDGYLAEYRALRAGRALCQGQRVDEVTGGRRSSAAPVTGCLRQGGAADQFADDDLGEHVLGACRRAGTPRRVRSSRGRARAAARSFSSRSCRLAS